MLRKSLVLLAASCSCISIAHAGDKPVYAPTPAWVKAAPAIDAAKLTDADPMLLVIDQQQRIDHDKVWLYVERTLRVPSTQAMGQIGSVQLPWMPDQGDLIVHEANILRGGERIDLIAQGQRFQVLQREQQLEQSALSGILTATLAVEGLRVGDVLQLRYSITRADKTLKGNIQTAAPLVPDTVRVNFARASISWPSGTPIKWKAYSQGPAPSVSKAGGYDTLEIPVPLEKQPEMPGDAPARFQPLPIVEASTFADWAAVSSTMEPLYRTAGTIAPGSPLAAVVAKIAASSADPRVRATAALRLVQDEVRYLLKSMDGGNYTPQSPAQTWELRYGDCKAKTLLLLAILRELGIEAEAVLANVTLSDSVAVRLPAPMAFDHVVVRATVGGKQLWLDGTMSGARLADLDDTPAFLHALPLRASGATVERVAGRPPARPMSEVTLDIDQSAGLSLPSLFSVTMAVRGDVAAMMQMIASQATKEQLSEFIQSTVGNVIDDPLIVERAMRYDPETATATLTASGIYTTPWRRSEGRYRMALDKSITNISFEPDRARPAWKDIPALSPISGNDVVRVRVRLPDGGKGFTIEGDRTLPATLAGGRLQRSATIGDGWLKVEDQLQGAPGTEIAPADIARVRGEVALARTRMIEGVAPATYPARWQVVAAARREKRLDPILAAYAKAIAEDPKDVSGYSNRAAFLFGTYDWKGAAADYDKIIALEPSAGVYLQRSAARQAMRDVPGALADAEAALALDPGASGVVSRVATLRFEKGDRDGALAMIAERVAAGGKDKRGYVSTQATLLGDAGRKDEAVAALDSLIASNPGNATLLNGRCWLKGTLNVALDSALKDCTKGIELAENPAAIYDSRAMVYFRLGKMEDALADLNAALEVAPDQSASLYLRGVVRKRMGDAKGSEADLAAARMMWPITDDEYRGWGIVP